MKSHLTVLLIVTLFLPVVLMGNFTYLGEEDYGRLNRQERKVYNQNLENELLNLQQRKADAIAREQQYNSEIEELRNRISAVDSEYQVVYNRIINSLNLTQSYIDAARRKVDEIKQKLTDWSRLSDSDIWQYAKEVNQTIDEYNSFKQSPVSKAPDFRNDIVEIDRLVVSVEGSLSRGKPKYYEDNYTVVRGDYLAKIAGYSFIYNDSSKWGIIYRANRDQIKDPNLIYVDQVLKIPRGLPDTWKVYRGESLWRIASYPEVYGSGTQWPLIYRANQDQIRNPDLIYPDQILRIPRN